MPAKVKYHPDTPVTIQMLADLHREYGHLKSAEWIESHIETPKPEPKDPELWICRIKNTTSDIIALWKFSDGWGVYKSGLCAKWEYHEIQPLQMLLPAEDEG